MSPEPAVFDMIRLAANHVDRRVVLLGLKRLVRLKRGERQLLQELHLGAKSLGSAFEVEKPGAAAGL